MKILCLSLLLLCILLPTAMAEDEMQIRFFNVGKADAILITAPDCNVLVDTGTKKGGKSIAAFLQEAGIETLDALIITHFDKDHVGGAANILKKTDVRRVLEPNYTEDSKQTEKYREALLESGLSPEALQENISFTIGNVSFAIDVADAAYDDENDMSLVVTVEYSNKRILLAGDAENDRLWELLAQGNLDCDLLKVPHHGKAESLSGSFFRACLARYAVITSDEDDLEDDFVIDSLAEIGTKVYLTRNGDVIAHIPANGDMYMEQP